MNPSGVCLSPTPPSLQVLALQASKVSALAMCNELLFFTILLGHALKRVFFGRLREAEIEHLYERSWCALLRTPPPRRFPTTLVRGRYAITETCLAMTIFREEFNFRFVAWFTVLLFGKIFHWLMQDRISYMEQTPAVSLLTHVRMLLLMATLFVGTPAIVGTPAGTPVFTRRKCTHKYTQS